MNLSNHNLLPKYNSQANISHPLNLPPPGEYNWDYGNGNEVPKSFICNLYDDFDGFKDFYAHQPRRRRPILPRSSLCRPTVPPETATTYKCAFYHKRHSKRCPIWPRNHLRGSGAPPPRWTMNQLSYACRLNQKMWY